MKRLLGTFALCLLMACSPTEKPHTHGRARGVDANRDLIDFQANQHHRTNERVEALEHVVFPPDAFSILDILDITDDYELIDIRTQCRNETEFWSIEHLSTLSNENLDAVGKIADRMATRRVRIEAAHAAAMRCVVKKEEPTPTPVAEITKEPAVTAEQFTEACKHINALHQFDRTHVEAHEKMGSAMQQILARIDALDNTKEEHDEGRQ